MAKLTGAHLFIRCLKLEGIAKVFTICGDPILPLVDAPAGDALHFTAPRPPAPPSSFPIAGGLDVPAAF